MKTSHFLYIVAIILIALIALAVIKGDRYDRAQDAQHTNATNTDTGTDEDTAQNPDDTDGPTTMDPSPVGHGIPDDIQAHIDSKADKIVLESPVPGATIPASATKDKPLVITGKARGNWFFEASFPVTLVDWNGLIVAQGIAQTSGNWMTEEFVPFEAKLTYTIPAETLKVSKRASLILQKDNPSGEARFDDALEVPMRFE